MNEAIGVPIPLNAGQLQDLVQSVQSTLEYGEAIVSVHHANVGQHWHAHFVCQTSHGRLIGLKDNLAVNKFERAAQDVCRIVRPPNLTASQEIEVPASFPKYPTQPALLSLWLRDGFHLGQANTISATQAIRTDDRPSPFFDQFGKWMAFGLSIGASDRSDRNWVWSKSDQLLIMIDFESAFTGTDLSLYQLLFALYAAENELSTKQRKAAFDGYCNMHSQLQGVKDRLQQCTNDHVIEWNWLNQLARWEPASAPIKTFFGLVG